MPLSLLSLISVLAIGVSSTAIPGTGTWHDWTCPSPATEILSLTETQYVPVTTTEVNLQTSVVTLYQTITTTEVVYQTEETTEIFPTTVVQPTTVVTTSPVTLTATEAVSIYSSTTRFTSLKLCPTRIANPTFTIQAPLPTDWTWGCPPGWLCKPEQIDCDFEVGLPDRNFYCAPNECVPAEPLPNPLPTWNTDPSGNLSALTDPSLTVNALDSYFNMNPTDFGLTYQVFVVDRVVTFTSTILIPPAPTMAARGFRSPYRRQFQTVVPAPCYDWCNNMLLEAQSQGKSPALCRPGSAFETTLLSCLICIAKHPTGTVKTVAGLTKIAPQFQQFLDYCNQTATIVSGSAVVASATPAASTTLTLVPTTEVTIMSSSPATSAPVSAPESSAIVSPSGPSPPTSNLDSSALASTTVATPAATSRIGSQSIVPLTTTETLATTITTVEGPSTLTGTQLSSLTIIVIGADNSTTTMSGPDLSGATVIMAGNTTSSYTSTYTTVVTTSGPTELVASSSPTSVVTPTSPGSGTTSGPTASQFTGAAVVIIPHYKPSLLCTLLVGLITLFWE